MNFIHSINVSLFINNSSYNFYRKWIQKKRELRDLIRTNCSYYLPIKSITPIMNVSDEDKNSETAVPTLCLYISHYGDCSPLGSMGTSVRDPRPTGVTHVFLQVGAFTPAPWDTQCVHTLYATRPIRALRFSKQPQPHLPANRKQQPLHKLLSLPSNVNIRKWIQLVFVNIDGPHLRISFVKELTLIQTSF